MKHVPNQRLSCFLVPPHFDSYSPQRVNWMRGTLVKGGQDPVLYENSKIIINLVTPVVEKVPGLKSRVNWFDFLTLKFILRHLYSTIK